MPTHIPPLHAWEPLTVTEVEACFGDAPMEWGLAGGYALELATGQSWRDHGDIDVVVFRDQQIPAQRTLLERGFRLYAADPPGALRPWLPQEWLGVGVHDIWCHVTDASSFQLQLMLQEASATRWIYRRDDRVSGPRQSFFVADGSRRYIRPEIQLLYKSKGLREKDEQDFVKCAPMLTVEARAWLRASLDTASPGHPWVQYLDRLGGGPDGTP